MVNFVDIGLLLITAILLGITGGFVAKAAASITDIPNYSTIDGLRKAHDWLSGSAVAAWIGLAIVITLIVLYLIFGSESVEVTGGIVTTLLLFLTLFILLVVAILALIGTIEFHGTPNAAGNPAERDAIIGTILAFMGFILVILLLIYNSTKGKEEQAKLEQSKISPTPSTSPDPLTTANTAVAPATTSFTNQQLAGLLNLFGTGTL